MTTAIDVLTGALWQPFPRAEVSWGAQWSPDGSTCPKAARLRTRPPRNSRLQIGGREGLDEVIIGSLVEGPGDEILLAVGGHFSHGLIKRCGRAVCCASGDERTLPNL